MDKLDLFKLHNDEYAANVKPRLISVAPANYLSVSGRGAPGGDMFQSKLEALYAVAFTVKAASKQQGQDYAISKLEGLWWGDFGYESFSALPRDTWNWTLLIRTPVFIVPSAIRNASKALLHKGKPPEVLEVAPFSLDEGQCAQMLHRGSYEDEYKTLAILRAFIQEQGLNVHGLHHEIYLSDPRKTAPEKLKTVLRLPVTKNE
jgi:hypothetical protein